MLATRIQRFAGARFGSTIIQKKAAGEFMQYNNPLPGVPDVESPFFENIIEAKGLDAETQRIASELNEKGFAVIDFPDEDFDAKVERIQQDLNPRYDWDQWKSTGWANNDGLRVQDAWAFNQDVASISCNAKILNLLQTLYGRKPVPFQSLNFPVSTQQATHSDSAHFSSIPERFMCGVWVAMEDTDEDNGALIYYPGSHKLPIYTNEHVGACSIMQEKSTEHYGKLVDVYDALISKHDLKREVFCAKKGQALIWAANLLHGGGKQKDQNRTRWSQVTHYYFDNCVYYTPILSDPIFGNVYYRNISDISTGDKKKNIYNNWEVPEAVLTRPFPLARELNDQPVHVDSGEQGFSPWKRLVSSLLRRNKAGTTGF